MFPELDILKKNNIKPIYFTYFFKWNILDNLNYVSNRINFKLAPNNRTDGTFTNFDSLDDKIDNLYYYMQLIKFGFGRSVRDASRLIMYNEISRKKGLENVLKFDHEFPNTYLDYVLDYLDLKKTELLNIIDKHRNVEIWEQKKENWKLKFDFK